MSDAVATALRDALVAALARTTPTTELGRAVVAVLSDAARDPALIPDVVAWVRGLGEGRDEPMPLDISPRESGVMLSALQRAEAEHRRGVAQLIGGILEQVLRILSGRVVP